jgi:hypothetical protein
MRKLFIAALILAAAFSTGLAQENNTAMPNMGDPLKLGHAPAQRDGLGRAVVVVKDEGGNPVRGVNVKLDSHWGGDEFCESWGLTDAGGVIALNPIHMGTLRLNVKAKGYQTQKLTVDASSLNEPVRVTLTRKK